VVIQFERFARDDAGQRQHSQRKVRGNGS
jgi:hypothetical protein